MLMFRDGDVFLVRIDDVVTDLIQVTDNNYLGSHILYNHLKSGAVIAIPKWLAERFVDSGKWEHSKMGTKLYAMC